MKHRPTLLAFGQHLRRLRQQRGWSQQALADVADVAKKTVYRIEAGQASPTLDVLVSLAEGLELSLPELVQFPLLLAPDPPLTPPRPAPDGPLP
ncbi:helix-turn-helix domain-containing protein [Hymenobacter sublimis]|uniref:Helix-turn-helix domain-containing protein n=1 Tax=Hymenobacter sublimis TaxID=2933777 RepID=A0ABY4JEI1_9BACT|nr:helix-turn-helix transcriptional regulator [Hymenobacter sublimis]UPL50192.1 helix-turn-helix domain-containing protein [Hymenobacter sublimis]